MHCPTAISHRTARCVPLMVSAPRHHISRTARQNIRVAAASNEDEAAQMAALQEAMKDPAVAQQMAAMEEQMKDPQVQNEMAMMQQMMSNPQYMQRMAELREDPELAPIFEEIKAGGMGAMMKFMNDPTFLSKIGEKLADLDLPGMANNAPPVPVNQAAAAASAPPPVVNNILDAAKYGDIEAIEDYMAIGKGDLRDENGRGCLHYAVAYDQGAAAGTLLDNGADVSAVDEGGNTPLHYAAGYGRGNAVKALVRVGADVNVKNGDGQTAVELIRGEPRNPLNTDAEIMAMLEAK
ncbi:putative Ankyrin repeat domain-containing protein 2A [Nannochloris sp. 'desiccata']|nr:putative Ankyrin repeat domain-containing protein 2A [Chlorella desiccata (nom. nud.)]